MGLITYMGDYMGQELFEFIKFAFPRPFSSCFLHKVQIMCANVIPLLALPDVPQVAQRTQKYWMDTCGTRGRKIRLRFLGPNKVGNEENKKRRTVEDFTPIRWLQVFSILSVFS